MIHIGIRIRVLVLLRVDDVLLIDKFMTQMTTKIGDIARGRRVSGDDVNHFPRLRLTNGFMQQHNRLWANQPLGIELVIGIRHVDSLLVDFLG